LPRHRLFLLLPVFDDALMPGPHRRPQDFPASITLAKAEA
jgi:hypothetical protein